MVDSAASITDAAGFRRKLNVTQAAEYLGLSVAFMNKLRVSGGGPLFARLGSGSQSRGRVVYDPADLEHWVEGRKRASTSGQAA